jgi:hypothetical protein
MSNIEIQLKPVDAVAAAAAAIRRSCTSYRTSTPVAAPDSAAGGGDATPALSLGLKPPSALRPTPKPTLRVE